MSVILFESNEVNFNHRGLGTLKDTTLCDVEEQRNGLYELYLEYPLWGIKSNMLIEERIIQASAPDGYQLFRIYKTSQDDEKSIKKVYAAHIFYDLEDNFIEDTNVVSKTGAGALEQILSNTQYTHRFTGLSDISIVANSRLVRRSPVTAILDTDEDNSFLNRWGGELKRDNFTISILTRRGADRGVTIKHGKNLKGLVVETDMKAIATRIMPEGYNGLLLPEKYVDSPLLNNYEHPKIRKYDFSDIKAQVEGEELNEGELPLADAYQALRDATNKLYSESKVDIPPTTMKVDFLELRKTEEYKNCQVLERIYPWDTVTIKHSRLNINIKVDMNYYKWNSLKDEYQTIELGNEISSIANTISKIDTLRNNMQVLETSVLQRAKDNATSLINTGLGGYVLKTRDELLIMDTDNINTAQKIWRWNLNGLGYSSTGYKGEFGIAMTRDGAIVADFITTGNLSAALITTGILTAVTIKNKDGSFQIDLSGSGGAKFFNNGKLAMQMANNALNFYNYDGLSEYIGKLGTVAFAGVTTNPAIMLANNTESSTILGYKTEDGTFYPYLMLDKYNKTGYGSGISIWEELRILANLNMFGEISMINHKIYLNMEKTLWLQATSDGNMHIQGGIQVMGDINVHGNVKYSGELQKVTFS